MIQQSHSWAYVHTENMNTLIQKDTCKKKKKDTCTSVFIPPLFTIAKTLNDPNAHQQTTDLRRYDIHVLC